MRLPRLFLLTIFFAGLFLFDGNIHAQRITTPLDESRTVTLRGNRPAMARAEFDAGPASADYAMSKMILTLRSSAARQTALAALLEAQQDPASPSYHQWLTPQQFEEQFGVSEQDADRVAEWLTSHGFSIDEIPAGRRSIIFSGTAAQVAEAFHAQIHVYNVRGQVHHANASDPQIPEALADVVAGTVSLHDFRRAPMYARLQALSASAPDYTTGSTHYLTPADFSTIYDVNALYNSSMNGAGQSIAIVGRTNISVSDVQTFRSTFGLAANNPTVIVNGADPGIISIDEEAEADLDVEWSGAVAPKATVKFVVSASTDTTDGVDLSAQYIVSNNTAPVMSTSFGSCEASMGSSERSFYNNLWQQAAAEGITALIASGDSGAAGCDSGSESKATGGLAVNGLCSTPYSVCVGGTEFNDASNPTLYWSATNASTYGSALSYIPEAAWNESGSVSGGSGLWATGGGASAYYSKPSWQTGTGVPADGKRDVPDVSVSAAGHDGYFVDILGSFYIISGTSAASPSMAGVMALVNQKTASRQGNANTTFYGLATLASQGGAAVFHSMTGGNNSVPGLSGFTAGPHYNQATGLGSPDAFVLVNHWTDVHATPSFSVSLATTSASISPGAQTSVTATVTDISGFSGAVSLSVNGLPSGVTASFTPSSFAAPGAGSSTWKLASASSAAAGTFTLTVSATSGSTVKMAQFTLTIVPLLTVSVNPAAVSIARDKSGTLTVTTTAGSGFNSAVQLSVTGLPSGVTASFSTSKISAPGSGSSVLTLTAASSTATGAYALTILATGTNVIEQAAASVTIVAPTFTMSASPAALTLGPAASSTVQIGVAAVNGFSGTVSFAASGLPTGVTASFNGSQMRLTASTSTAGGVYAIRVTGSSSGISPSPYVVLTLTISKFAISSSTSTLSVARGQSGTVTLAVSNPTNASYTLSISGIPKGVTPGIASVSVPTSLPLAFAVSSSVTVGTYAIVINATGAGVTSTVTLSLTVH